MSQVADSVVKFETQVFATSVLYKLECLTTPVFKIFHVDIAASVINLGRGCITVCILCYCRVYFPFFTTVPPAPTFAHITTVYNNSKLIGITSQINIMVQRVPRCIQL